MKRCLAYSLSAALFFGIPVGTSAQGTPVPAPTAVPVPPGALDINFAYNTLSSGSGPVRTQWSGDASGWIPIKPNWGLNLQGGLDTTSGAGNTTNGVRLQTSIVWNPLDYSQVAAGIRRNHRTGLSIGYQNNVTTGFPSTPTWNYGGFIDLFPSPYVTLSAKGGLISNCGASNGTYLGGGATYYPTPNLSIGVNWDYSHFAFGAGENDYGVRANVLPSSNSNTFFYGGFKFTRFSPGSAYINSLGAGIGFYGGGAATGTQNDRDRSGPLDNSHLYLGLQCKF